MASKALLALAVMGALTISIAGQASAAGKRHTVAQHYAKVSVAPADEYFGRQKMSTLGIDNVIRDMGMHETFNPELGTRWVGPLLDAEDALVDWASKYPQDGWIPKRAYELSHELWKTRTSEGSVAADRCRNLLFRLFPSSRYAAAARGETAVSVK